ncbi:MAG: protein translocase subunit SecD [Lachnospiraceae bacterium]|nr:protein translocase subunit SecD [Lachnospiraceae bacterium]MCD7766706.1 protein translocase subunit SecD [Lachnospiraceae bacterium]
MNKKNARITLVVMALLLIFFAFVSLVGFGSSHKGSARNIILGLDLSGGVSVTYQVVDENPTSEEMSDTVYKLQQRADTYSTEANVYQEGSDRINIEIPGVTDVNEILEELGQPGSLEFQLDDGTVVLTGSEVDTASAGTQQDDLGNTEYVVKLELTSEGAEAFATATSENVGNYIYIVYNDEVISAPVVNEAITGGTAIISGMSDAAEAQSLASSIRIGALSLELEELSSKVVGAQLGQNAIKTSLTAGAIGIVIVMIFMIIVYALPGIVAAFCLLLYICMFLICLNGFDMTLTLPGIAGIILTIGMAVDANVIIYARIREEISAGKSVKGAIDAGYKKAFSAILDGNVTTLIAAFVLNMLGTGSVKGFAQTLALGIVLSMITALIISRLIMNALYQVGFRDEKYYGKAKTYKAFDFVGHRRVFFAVSIVLILVGPVCMGINSAMGNGALNLSLDFKGGTSTTVSFNEEMTLDELESDVKPIFTEITGDAEVQFQTVQDSSDVYIKTAVLDLDQRQEVSEALQEAFDLEETAITYESISATVSNEMRQDAVVAVIVAAICMLIYITIRFHDVRFAGSAVLALLHDVLVVFACYALVRISVGSTFIACMLTIVGYSINATIVIFDRIRENQKLMAGDSLAQIVNTSVTQTLTRSIYTSFTTFITIFMLYILGIATIKEFALPLIVGIVAGAYSSVCVTGSLWYVMKSHQKQTAAANGTASVNAGEIASGNVSDKTAADASAGSKSNASASNASQGTAKKTKKKSKKK